MGAKSRAAALQVPGGRVDIATGKAQVPVALRVRSFRAGQQLSTVGCGIDSREIGEQHLRGVRNVVAQELHPAICVPADGGVYEGLVLGARVAFVLREQGDLAHVSSW
jgi:hypothetical protein